MFCGRARSPLFVLGPDLADLLLWNVIVNREIFAIVPILKSKEKAVKLCHRWHQLSPAVLVRPWWRLAACNLSPENVWSIVELAA